MLICLYRFSESQNKIILEYYNAGMVEIGKQYADLIATVGEESGLTKEQIEVHIIVNIINYLYINFRETHIKIILYTGLDQTKKYEEEAWRRSRRVISVASCEEEKVESVAVLSKNFC